MKKFHQEKRMRVACRMPRYAPFSKQSGTLTVSLLMLILVLLLGTSAAQIALFGEKASRNDRDRQIAFQAAEAALADAELDIQDSPDPARSRSHLFSKHGSQGFPGADEPVCAPDNGQYQGLCRSAKKGEAPAWLTVDFSTDSATDSIAVPYGKFTGRRLQVGAGSLQIKEPRYIIERVAYTPPGESADTPSYFYRITAVGYGTRESTHVALQTYYRKEDL